MVLKLADKPRLPSPSMNPPQRGPCEREAQCVLSMLEGVSCGRLMADHNPWPTCCGCSSAVASLARRDPSRIQARRDDMPVDIVCQPSYPGAMASNPSPISGPLKLAIKQSGLTHYRIAKDAEITPEQLDRFMSGERDLRLSSADKVASCLGLGLRPATKRKAKA